MGLALMSTAKASIHNDDDSVNPSITGSNVTIMTISPMMLMLIMVVTWIAIMTMMITIVR